MKKLVFLLFFQHIKTARGWFKWECLQYPSIGVGRIGGQWDLDPWILKFDIFSIKFFTKRIVFVFSSG